VQSTGMGMPSCAIYAHELLAGYGARVLAPLFERPAAWRVLDGAIALVMWAIAAALLRGA